MPPWIPGQVPDVKIKWKSIVNVPTPLKRFIAAPVAFMFGAFLSVFFDGLEVVVTATLDAVLFVVEGDTVGSTAGMLGIVDIPRLAANLLTDAGGWVGTSLTAAVGGVLLTLRGVVAAAGPAAPVLLGVILAGLIVGSALAVRWLYNRLADVIVPL